MLDMWVQVPEEIASTSPFCQAGASVMMSDSLTVRPQDCFSTQVGASDGDNNDGNTSDECQCKEGEHQDTTMPVEEGSDEALTPKGVAAPSPPSRQERLEHELTRLPVRSWCELCVTGTCRADQYMSTGQLNQPHQL